MKQEKKLNSKLMIQTLIVLAFCFPINVFSGAKDGGGGAFTKAKFWYVVDTYIIPRLSDLKEKNQKLLTENHIDKILEKMDEDLVEVEIVDKELYTYENGKQELVDAKNYPKENRIELNKREWNARLDSGFSYYYLILHEFMGLAGVPDINARISRQIIPPEKLPIDFDVTRLQCISSIQYVQLHMDEKKSQVVNWTIRDAPYDRQDLEFGEVQSLNPKPICDLKNEDTGKCHRYIQDYKIKSAKLRLPVSWYPYDLTGEAFDFAGLDYEIEFEVTLMSEYYSYGSWGAAQDLFKRSPAFNVQWKVIQKNLDGTEFAIHSSQATKYETNMYGHYVSLKTEVILPELEKLMAKNSYSLGYAAYNGEVSSKNHPYNIAGYLNSVAESAGHIKAEDRNKFIVEEVLKGSKFLALPFHLDLACVLRMTD